MGVVLQVLLKTALLKYQSLYCRLIKMGTNEAKNNALLKLTKIVRAVLNTIGLWPLNYYELDYPQVYLYRIFNIFMGIMLLMTTVRLIGSARIFLTFHCKLRTLGLGAEICEEKLPSFP